jgi:hypothetical protein
MMKIAICCSLLLLACARIASQSLPETQNIFIITTDGFRWQEVFTGADSALLNNTSYVQDTSLMKALYWDEHPIARRRKLMPFLWNVVAEKGQLYGDRFFENKVNVKNLYKISYPGYSEILTGYTDPRIVINLPRNNRNPNILEYLNNAAGFRGKVVAFSSWNLFPYILNAERSKFPINSGYEKMPDQNNDTLFKIFNSMQDKIAHQSHTRLDCLTFLNAREYIEQYQPRVVFIGLGETDEFAHASRYDLYLQQAAAIDKMIADLWYYVQTHPFYKDKTTFIISTDHGRGDRPSNWHTHSFLTKGSAETWLAMLGPGIAPKGELKIAEQTYENQYASTIAMLLGLKFESTRHIGKPMILPELESASEIAKGRPVLSK